MLLLNIDFYFITFKATSIMNIAATDNLYIANVLIGFFFKNAINLSTTNNAVIKATTKPTASAIFSLAATDEKSNFLSSSPDAPIITGIAKKNENSVATVVESPATHPPIMVDADLDIPGHIARH